MSSQPGMEPIGDDEILYRRIPVSMQWYAKESGLSPEAFDPRQDETTGISVFRSKYKRLEDAALGKSKRGYWIAVLPMRALRAQGIQVEPRPLPDEPGHAELPGLTCHNRLTEGALGLKVLLASLCASVEGPFPAQTTPSETT